MARELGWGEEEVGRQLVVPRGLKPGEVHIICTICSSGASWYNGPMSPAVWLPPLNTALILLSGLALLIGYAAIRRGDVGRHRSAMLTAAVFAALFLVVYGIRWALVGSKPFEGSGWLRTAYILLLATHIVLAAALLPLVLATLAPALRADFRRHRAMARIAFPLWLYVAASGWLIYGLLYWLPHALQP